MTSEVQFRAAIVYLLVFFAFPLIGWRRTRQTRRVTGAVDTSDWHIDRWLAYLLFLGPLLAYVFDPDLFPFTRLRWTPLARWLPFGSAVAAMLLLIWACRSTEGDAAEATGGPVTEGPYRWIRHPQFAAMSLFFVSLASMTDRWPVIVSSLMGASLLRLTAAPRIDTQMVAAFGGDFTERLTTTGSFFFKMATPREASYVVPRRFGLSALLALMTALALLFGWFHSVRAHPVIYLFAASQITAICLVQIFFGKSPRGASAATGAILWPLFAFLMMSSRSIPFGVQAILVVGFVGFGALIGYCIGALAAGFFLVMDMVEQYLPGGGASAAAAKPSAKQHP